MRRSSSRSVQSSVRESRSSWKVSANLMSRSLPAEVGPQAPVAVAEDALDDPPHQAVGARQARGEGEAVGDRAGGLAPRLDGPLVLPQAHAAHGRSLEEPVPRAALDQREVVVVEREDPE